MNTYEDRPSNALGFARARDSEAAAALRSLVMHS
jgi:hypothetical protein